MKQQFIPISNRFNLENETKKLKCTCNLAVISNDRRISVPMAERVEELPQPGSVLNGCFVCSKKTLQQCGKYGNGC